MLSYALLFAKAFPALLHFAFMLSHALLSDNLLYSLLLCSTKLYSPTLCCSLFCSTLQLLRSAVLSYALLYNSITLLHSAVLFPTLLYKAIFSYAVLCSPLLCYTTLYSLTLSLKLRSTPCCSSMLSSSFPFFFRFCSFYAIFF